VTTFMSVLMDMAIALYPLFYATADILLHFSRCRYGRVIPVWPGENLMLLADVSRCTAVAFRGGLIFSLNSLVWLGLCTCTTQFRYGVTKAKKKYVGLVEFIRSEAEECQVCGVFNDQDE
jgi:hypothetical protein